MRFVLAPALCHYLADSSCEDPPGSPGPLGGGAWSSEVAQQAGAEAEPSHPKVGHAHTSKRHAHHAFVPALALGDVFMPCNAMALFKQHPDLDSLFAQPSQANAGSSSRHGAAPHGRHQHRPLNSSKEQPAVGAAQGDARQAKQPGTTTAMDPTNPCPAQPDEQALASPPEQAVPVSTRVPRDAGKQQPAPSGPAAQDAPPSQHPPLGPSALQNSSSSSSSSSGGGGSGGQGRWEELPQRRRPRKHHHQHGGSSSVSRGQQQQQAAQPIFTVDPSVQLMLRMAVPVDGRRLLFVSHSEAEAVRQKLLLERADQIKAQQQQQSLSGSLQPTPSGPAAGLTGWLSSMGSWLQPQPSAPPSSSSTPSSPPSLHPFSPSSSTPTATGPAAAAALRPPDAGQQEGRGQQQQPHASPGKGSGAGVGAPEALLGTHSLPGHGHKPGALPPLIVAQQTLKALPLLGDMLTAQLQQAEEEATLREAQQLRSGGGLKAGAKGSQDPGRAISHVGRLPLEAALTLVSGHPHHFALLGSEEDGQVASQWQGRRAMLDMAEPLAEWELRATPALLAAEEGAVQPTTTTPAITTNNNPGPRLPGLLPFPVRLPFQATAPQPVQVQGQAHVQEQGQGQGQGLTAGPLGLSRHEGVPDSAPAPRTPVFQLPGLALTLKTAGGQALHLVPTFLSLPQLLSAVVVGRQVAARLWLRGRRSWREQFARQLEASALALSGFSPSFVPPPSSSSTANRDTEDEDDDGEGYGQPPEAKQLLQELGEPNKASAAAAAASLAAAAAARFPPDTGLAAHITQIALGVVRLSGRAFCVAGNICDNWVADSPWGEGMMGLPPRLAVQTGFLEDVVSELALHNALLKTTGAESSRATETVTGHDAASAASDRNGAGAGDTIQTGQDAHLPAGSATSGVNHGAEIGLPARPASRGKHRTAPLAPGSKPGYWAGSGLRPTQVLQCQAGVALLLEAAWMVLQEACVGDGDLAAGIAHNVAHEAASSSWPAGEVSLLMSVQLKAQALQRPTASPSSWLPLLPSSPAALSNHQLQFPTSPTPAATPAPPTRSSQHPTVDIAAQASSEAPPPSAVPAGPSPAAPSPLPSAAQATPRAQGAAATPPALPPSLTTHLPGRPPGHTPEQPAGQAGPQPGSSASAAQAHQAVNQPEAGTSVEQTSSDSPTSPQTSTTLATSNASADLTAAAPVSIQPTSIAPPAVPLQPKPTLPSQSGAPSPPQPLPVKGGSRLLAGSREAEHKFEVGVYINTRKLFDEEALDAPNMLKDKQDTTARGLLLLGDLGLDVDDDDGELWKAPPLGFINLAANTRFAPTHRS